MELTSDPLRAPQLVLARHGPDQLPHLGAQRWPATSRAGLPPPEQAPTLPMPAHHSFRRDEHQALTPTGTEAASQHPKGLIPGVKPSPRSGASRPGRDGQLVPQQQVLEDEVLARAYPDEDGREEQPEQIKHAFSMADYGRPTFCPPTTLHGPRFRPIHNHQVQWTEPTSCSFTVPSPMPPAGDGVIKQLETDGYSAMSPRTSCAALPQIPRLRPHTCATAPERYPPVQTLSPW
jgi:hypothetical protein